jgi:hypothetical protein
LANCFPLKIESLKARDIEKRLIELEQAQLIRLYTVDGRRYGHFVTWGKHQRVYKDVDAKFPEPPADCGDSPQNAAKCGSYSDSGSDSDSDSDTDLDTDGVSALEGFKQFWMAYPRKKAKGTAEKAWKNLQPDNELQHAILTALEQAKLSAEWVKEGGQFIPYPATWLNAKRWLDEHTSSGNADWKANLISVGE